MGIIAERAYSKENKNKRKETEEEREYKLARIYNKIFFAISNVKTAQDYLKMRNAISAYASEAGVEYASEVKRLTKMLNERIIEIEIELEKNIVIRQIRRCLLRQIKTGLTEHLTMV